MKSFTGRCSACHSAESLFVVDEHDSPKAQGEKSSELANYYLNCYSLSFGSLRMCKKLEKGTTQSCGFKMFIRTAACHRAESLLRMFMNIISWGLKVKKKLELKFIFVPKH